MSFAHQDRTGLIDDSVAKALENKLIPAEKPDWLLMVPLVMMAGVDGVFELAEVAIRERKGFRRESVAAARGEQDEDADSNSSHDLFPPVCKEV